MNIFSIYTSHKHTYESVVCRFSMHAHNTPPFVFVNFASPLPHSLSIPIWRFSMARRHRANFTNVVTLVINRNGSYGSVVAYTMLITRFISLFHSLSLAARFVVYVILHYMLFCIFRESLGLQRYNNPPLYKDGAFVWFCVMDSLFILWEEAKWESIYK